MQALNIVLLAACLTASSFETKNLTGIETIPDFTISQNEFGAWKTTSCFKGLDFCVRRSSYNEYANKYEWHVKFRNRYVQNITFNCVATASNVSTARTTDRITVRPGQESMVWFLIPDANSVNVFVDAARFGSDEWGTDYANCDK
jgi:hypothetical protein